jgi:predicted nucleic acid-binding protein
VTRALLDTSALITQGQLAATDLPPTAAISVITLGELHAGVQLATDGDVAAARRRRLVAVRLAFAPLPVDEAVAERYGEVLAVARRQQRTVKATDLLIIATAAATARVLCTLDAAQARLAEAAGITVALI